ncbi:MAG TPA: DUF547 domain-containing protein [Anaerolineales bacterium]|nr:DUF547 domain-containing protein [Anaerolineales bacterium]
MTLPDTIIRGGNRALDFFLRVDPRDVLNAGIPTEKSSNPARAMMKASKFLLANAVNPDTGFVDYRSLRKSDAYAQFRGVAYQLSECKPSDLGQGPALMTFWINLYNALIIDAVVRFGVRGSVMSRPGIFRQAAYNVGGMRFSADEIEHGILRRNRPNPVLHVRSFAADDPRLSLMVDHLDPRIHFSLVCGARSCPPIAFYDHERLDRQLDQAAAAFINGDGVHYLAETNTLLLSKIFQWYLEDFGGLPAVLALVQSHVHDEEVRNALERRNLLVRYMRYDWNVNSSA